MEVLKSNFDERFSAIESAIKRCDFVAVDTEFTGLRVNEQAKPSLFDDAEERYKKLRQTITQITMTQIGLAAFIEDPEENEYSVETFNFYLYPRSFGPVDVRFICQASSLEFLTKYKFDFNKFIYQGLSHMNEEQEKELKDHINSKAMFSGIERDIDEKSMQKVCSRVAEWVVQCPENETMTISKEEMEGIRVYVLSTELKGRFPMIWTKVDSNRNIVIEKISLEKRQELETTVEGNQREAENKVVQNMLGFTRVFRVMRDLKKPLLGHNMLMDLMLMYDKFHRPLPGTYKEFKTGINQLFPVIYDTKHIASQCFKYFEERGFPRSTYLAGMYRDLDSADGRDLVIHPPTINHAEGFDKYQTEEIPHEAGYDAFMCGFVYLRLAHIITFKHTLSSDVIPCSFRRYLRSTDYHRNKINVIRARTNYIRLDGPEPTSRRPELLYVTSRMFKKKLNIDQLAKWFSPYGSVDIRLESPSKALVAAGNQYCAKDILKAFRKHNSICITKYNMWKHSPVVRGLLWAGTLASGGVCAWLLFSHNRKS